MDRAEISDMWRQTSGEVTTFFREMEPEEFSASRGHRWSYAKNLDHLIRAVEPVAGAMRIPKLLLRLLFGRGTTKRTYVEVQDHYKSRLLNGAEAPGRFVPSGGESQQRLLIRWESVSQRLESRMLSWSEGQLDGLRLPHPILGKITVREMLYFTDLHARHHLELCQQD